MNRGCDVIGTHIVAVTMISAIASSIAIKILLRKSIDSTLYYVDASTLEITALSKKQWL
jgi:hypothetical protein